MLEKFTVTTYLSGAGLIALALLAALAHLLYGAVPIMLAGHLVFVGLALLFSGVAGFVALVIRDEL